ncbi:MAG: hypothetical protein ACC631_02025 [Halocynthiibacter sp.]
MERKIRSFGGLGFVALLAACAQAVVPPAPIQPEPIYNKFGNAVGCEGDGIYDPNSELENPCLPPPPPPDGQCEPTAVAYVCEPGGDGGDNQRNPNSPTSP